MTRTTRWVLVFALFLGLAGRSEAASLKVSPARFIVHDVEPGTLYDIYKETGLRLTIYNDDDVRRTWVLSTHRPSERGRWEKGYAEIPDPRWCWFENTEVTVEPNTKGYGHLFLKVPDGEKYYNQHWVVTLGIGGKPARGGISLGVDIRVQIETKSKVDLKERPDGLLGLEPSTIEFEDVAPGRSEEAQVVLYNNDGAAHGYTIGSMFENTEIKKKTYLAHSYIAVPDSRWIRYDKKIQIEPGGSAVMPVRVEIPGDATNFGKKWEDILLIQPDEGPAGFVRVQVQTRKKNERGLDESGPISER